MNTSNPLAQLIRLVPYFTLGVLLATPFNLPGATERLTFALNGTSSEVTGVTGGSKVSPQLGPDGSLVVRGAGAATFSSHGVAFGKGGQQQANSAFYLFKGNLGEILDVDRGKVSFRLTSSYTFAERMALPQYNHRYVFQAHDGLKTHSSFIVTTQLSNRLIFYYQTAGTQTSYYVPQGQENILFGKGVTLDVTLTWEGNSSKLYLNGQLAATRTFTQQPPAWTPESSLVIGAQSVQASGGFFSCDDAISQFKVYRYSEPPPAQPPGTSEPLTFALNGTSSEVTGVTGGSKVSPQFGPDGSLVVRGAGTATFSSHGVAFGKGGQQQTNSAFYLFKGNLGEVLDADRGKVSFRLTSSYTFAERMALPQYNHRYVFQAHDGLKTHSSFIVTTQLSNRLIFYYQTAGTQTSYYVPQGQENTLFGKGVALDVTLTWEGNSNKLYLNGQLAATRTFTQQPPAWTPESSLVIGAQSVGGFFSCDDAISQFKVYRNSEPPPAQPPPAQPPPAQPPPPSISSTRTTNITVSSARIEVGTTTPTSLRVNYGTTTQPAQSISSSAMSTVHSLELPALEPATRYYFSLTATDTLSRTVSGSGEFVTDTPPPPTITDVTVSGLTQESAVIKVTTNTQTTAVVTYSDGLSAVLSTNTTPLSVIHTVQLVGLSPAKPYSFSVVVKDKWNHTASRTGQFHTAAPAPPAITDFIISGLTPESMVVDIVTTPETTATLRYRSAGSDGAREVTINSTGLRTRHSMQALGLAPSTQYDFTAEVKDKWNQSVQRTQRHETAGGSPIPSYSFNVPITIKEVAGTGANNYPVDVVVPLPAGSHSTIDTFRLVDYKGDDIPAQFKILNRWPDEVRSIRHLLVHFQTSVQAFSGAGTGLVQVYLRDDGIRSDVSPLSLWESTDMIEVTTGPLKFSVSKLGFKLIDAAWLDINQNGVFEENEQYVVPGTESGGVLRNFLGAVHRDSDRNDVRVTVEENGPRRVVIKAEALSRGSTSLDIRHGFAVRIYAYAGLSMVKIDYQLQSSSKENMFSWPLYFEELGLNLSLALPGDQTKVRVGMGASGGVFERSVSDGLYLAQESHNSFSVIDAASRAVQAKGTVPDGFIDLNDGNRGVTAVLRYFAETWPNGIRAKSSPSSRHTELSFQLFPEWSAQRYKQAMSPTGMYWLNDMQHVIKEVMLHFYAGNPDNLRSRALAETFRFHPVGTVPASWHREAAASLQFGGMMPDVNPPGTDVRLPKYLPSLQTVIGIESQHYRFGWENFGEPEPGYRDAPCTAGGRPYSSGAFLLTGNPSDYYEAELMALAELNRRPQWLPGYRHDADWARLKLTESPYCGGSWRAFLGHGIIPYSSPWLPDTGRTAGARDNQHGWFYHIEEAYYITGNPWIQDWYKFIAEFRRTTLEQLDLWPDRSGRARGHGANNAFQAYRVTSDLSLLDSIGTHIEERLRKDQDRFYGDRFGDPHGGYMTGYLASAVVNYLDESKYRDPQRWAQAFNYLSGLMEWNYNWGNFTYLWDVRDKKVPAPSNGTSTVLGDPVAWYYWHTGNGKYLDHLKLYITSGVNGGGKAAGNLTKWSGSYEGRWTTHVLNAQKDESSRPTPVLDLTASRSGPGVMLQWTTPQTSARFHIVWSDRPITAESTTNESTINWWAANPVGPALTPRPGQRQSVLIPAGSGPVFAAIFSFDEKWNLSEMSNVANVPQ